MTEPPRSSDTADDGGIGYDSEPAGLPRWVKVVGITLAILVLLVLIMLLVGGTGGHGPGRHG
ncbi:MAG TPA: hypothetical protein VKG85_05345 [Actinomycetes bacterium]|nr:hypothetical protein [Actinomycetes bacterium]